MTTGGTPTLYCANHPGRETLLRCNRCEKPICYNCATLTEVGYRCKDCVRGQQASFYNAQRLDLPLAALIVFASGALAGVLAYAILDLFGWFSFLIALVTGPAVGGGVAELIRRVLRRRRGPHLKLVSVIGFGLGILAGVVLAVIIPYGGAVRIFLDGRWLLGFFVGRLEILVFTAAALSALYRRLL